MKRTTLLCNTGTNNFVSKAQQTRYHVPSVFGDGKWRKKFKRQNLQLWKNWNKGQKAYSKYYIASSTEQWLMSKSACVGGMRPVMLNDPK